ncbi:MAG TPA: hypothetical protein VIT65_12600 [Microlunatus sp.]
MHRFPGRRSAAASRALSAHKAANHWRLVPYGLSEPYDQVSADPSTGGWGYELHRLDPGGPIDGERSP